MIEKLRTTLQNFKVRKASVRKNFRTEFHTELRFCFCAFIFFDENRHNSIKAGAAHTTPLGRMGSVAECCVLCSMCGGKSQHPRQNTRAALCSFPGQPIVFGIWDVHVMSSLVANSVTQLNTSIALWKQT